MARCLTCHRRLLPGATCPADGGAPAPAGGGAADAGAGAADAGAERVAAAPPAIAGYDIVGLLGTGGFGSVWEAVRQGKGKGDDRGADGVVALKVAHAADAAAIGRLGRESSAMAFLGPPHAPASLDSGLTADGRPWMAMERLVGHTLADELASWPGPAELRLVARLGDAVLRCVAALHARGVAHRDLKPENVFLVAGTGGDGGGRVVAKLMDFGLARAIGADSDTSAPVAPVGGTPEYMAPEQIASSSEADRRSDVYSLGVILYELLTLRLPFVGEQRELEYAHLSFRAPLPSRFAPVPPALEALVLRCLDKNPAARFPDGTALRAAFGQAIKDALPAGPGQAPALVTSSAGMPAFSPGGAEGAAAGPGLSVKGTQEMPAFGAGRATLPGSERQKVALVFLESDGVSPLDVQKALQSFGGQLAHLEPGRCVGAFTHRAGDNPGQRALAAAEALIGNRLARRAIVDVGTVTSKPRPDGGPPRLISALFTQKNRYPSASDPEKILVAAAAREMLSAVALKPASGRPDHFVLAARADEAGTRTVIQDGNARLFGRDGEVKALLEEAREALAARRPRVATVLGEPGLGKTRLAVEVSQRLELAHMKARLIQLRAREPMGGDPDETLAELLRRALDLPVTAPIDKGRALLTERLGEAAREIHTAAALVLGWIPPDDPAVQALRSAPGVLRANVARAGMEALRRLGSQQPVLVLLDDAHWADDALLDALEQATVGDLPLWVCALARPVFLQSRPTWGRRADHAHLIRLGPLDEGSAAALCRSLLEPVANVPEPVIARLIERTQAVPLLMRDLVRGLRREGLVKLSAQVWYVATEVLDRVPDSPLVEWLAGRELDELPPELAAHARLLSLLSPGFSAAEVAGVLAALEPDLSDAFPLDARIGIERLAQARLLAEHRTGRFAFRTDILREAVARTVAPPVAGRLHRSALAYYRAGDLPDPIRLPRLAWHAAQSGERQEAASTYLALAESARHRHNYLEADLLYTSALGQLDEAQEAERLQALEGRGVMRYRLGRHDGSLADLAQARDLAERGGNPWVMADVMLEESMALDWLFEWKRSRELAERARDLIVDRFDPLLESRVLLALGRSAHRYTKDREAAPLLREAVSLGEALGDEAYEVQVAANMMLGFLLPFLGLLDEAEERLARACALCEDKGDEMHLAGAWNNRSCLWIARNDRARFLADNTRVLAYARRMGNANLERNANLNSAYFLYWRAEYEAAFPFAKRVIEIDERYFRQGGFRPEGAVLLARILWGMGDEPAARKLVEEVRAQQATARAQGQGELLLPPNDEMLLDMIALMLGGGSAAEWDALMVRGRALAQGQELIEALEVAGLAAERRKDVEAARRWWHEALEAGTRIPNVMSDRIRSRLATLPG